MKLFFSLASLISHPVDLATRCQGYTVLGKTISVLTTFLSFPGDTAQANEQSSSVALDPAAISSTVAIIKCAAARCKSLKTFSSAWSSKLLLPFWAISEAHSVIICSARYTLAPHWLHWDKQTYLLWGSLFQKRSVSWKPAYVTINIHDHNNKWHRCSGIGFFIYRIDAYHSVSHQPDKPG